MFDTILLPVIIIAVIGLLAAIILAVASRFFAVKTDETFDKVRNELPGINCGSCGFAGCDDYAKKLAAGEAKTNLCTPGGDAVSRKISEVLGQKFEDVEERYAVVKCSGTCDAAGYVMDYQGPQTCQACNLFYQGRRSCSYACLGYGDCVDACKYDAIHIVDGIALVDEGKCTGCGMCAKRCPNHLIDIIPHTSRVAVACSSHDKGAVTRKLCSAGCIACRRCEKICPVGAVKVEDNLASIDPRICINCQKCVEVCPVKVIHVYDTKGPLVQ